MSRGTVAVLIVMFMIGGGFGLAIGAMRGRPVLGFVLGCLLTWIGWIVVAALPRKPAWDDQQLEETGIRGGTPIWRWAAIGLVSAFVVGGAVGLVVGLAANPSTAWFAVFEIGIPAASLGALLGLALGTFAYAIRRGRTTTGSTPSEIKS